MLKHQTSYPMSDWMQIFCRLSLGYAKHLPRGPEWAQVTWKQMGIGVTQNPLESRSDRIRQLCKTSRACLPFILQTDVQEDSLLQGIKYGCCTTIFPHIQTSQQAPTGCSSCSSKIRDSVCIRLSCSLHICSNSCHLTSVTLSPLAGIPADKVKHVNICSHSHRF